MRIAVAREADSAEDAGRRDAGNRQEDKALGAEVAVEPGAGVKSGMPDADIAAAGATRRGGRGR